MILIFIGIILILSEFYFIKLWIKTTYLINAYRLQHSFYLSHADFCSLSDSIQGFYSDNQSILSSYICFIIVSNDYIIMHIKNTDISLKIPLEKIRLLSKNVEIPAILRLSCGILFQKQKYNMYSIDGFLPRLLLPDNMMLNISNGFQDMEQTSDQETF